MDYSAIQIVVFDLDGTLAESKQSLLPEMGVLLSHLLKKLPVCVMSGGDFLQYEKQFLPFLPKDTDFSHLYLFPTSAGECLSFREGGWVREYSYDFSLDDSARIKKAILETIEETGISKDEAHFGPQIEDRGQQITFSALGQHAPLESKALWDSGQKKRHVFKEVLQKKIPEFTIAIGGTTSIDITQKGVSKETGIVWLEKRFGIHAKKILYVGDALYPGGNDTTVVPTGVLTAQVSGPIETRKIIETFLNK